MDATLIASVVGPIVTIVVILGASFYWLGGKFREIDMRFRQIDERFRQIDERFERIDKHLEEIDKRFEKVDEGFSEINKRFEGVDDRFDKLGRDLKNYADEKIGELKKYVDERFNRLINVVTGQNEFIIEFLGFRGVLDSRDVSFVKAALHSMVTMSTNPLTEAEKKRLLELIDKDELTLEEADELLRLARKFVMEYGDRGPDVWKMLWYAAAMHGITLRKIEERKTGEKREKDTST